MAIHLSCQPTSWPVFQVYTFLQVLILLLLSLCYFTALCLLVFWWNVKDNDIVKYQPCVILLDFWSYFSVLLMFGLFQSWFYVFHNVFKQVVSTDTTTAQLLLLLLLQHCQRLRVALQSWLTLRSAPCFSSVCVFSVFLVLFCFFFPQIFGSILLMLLQVSHPAPSWVMTCHPGEPDSPWSDMGSNNTPPLVFPVMCLSAPLPPHSAPPLLS